MEALALEKLHPAQSFTALCPGAFVPSGPSGVHCAHCLLPERALLGFPRVCRGGGPVRPGVHTWLRTVQPGWAGVRVLLCPAENGNLNMGCGHCPLSA